MITQIPSHLTGAFEFHSRTRVHLPFDDRAEPSPAILPLLPFLRKLHNEHLNGKTHVQWFLNPTSPQTLTLTQLFADSLTHKHLSHLLLDRAEVLPCLLLLLLLLLPFLFLENYTTSQHEQDLQLNTKVRSFQCAQINLTPHQNKPSAQRIFT